MGGDIGAGDCSRAMGARVYHLQRLHTKSINAALAEHVMAVVAASRHCSCSAAAAAPAAATAAACAPANVAAAVATVVAAAEEEHHVDKPMPQLQQQLS